MTMNESYPEEVHAAITRHPERQRDHYLYSALLHFVDDLAQGRVEDPIACAIAIMTAHDDALDERQD